MQDPPNIPEAENTMQVLRDIFGFHSFLPNQREIVQAILARQDAFVVMPTGGGKSLCYQLPAHMMDGTCVVISPLISLMKDQVDAAIATGLRASFLNSSLSASMKRQVEADLAAGKLDLIYVSPERFAMPEFIATLKRVTLSFVAIDEAHCISEWGHDFRPDYLNLSTIVHEFPDVPVAAFTATATHRVQEDIVAKLGLRSPHVVRASFNRPNLFYKVIPKQKPGDQILRFVRDHSGEPGIIYRTTRKSVEQTASMLTKHGIKALPYHAGLDDATRVKNQDAFNRDEIDVIVATVAFGMGIDKSNVRYVLHGDLPKNIESYYQETGRSGRDGEPAHCLLLFGYGDIPKIRFFLDEITDEAEKKHAIKCLNDMVHYATVHACRRKQLLNYFGEVYPPARDEGGNLKREIGDSASHASGVAGSAFTPPLAGPLRETALPCCDICQGEVESIDATRDAQILMSAIARTGERFGINHVVAVVTGEDTDRIRQLGHDQVKTYGAGKDQDKRHWRLMIDNLLAQGFIQQTTGDYPVLKLQPESREVLFGGREVHILKTRRKAAGRPIRRAGREAGPPARHTAPAHHIAGALGGSAVGGYNEELFDHLRDLRKELATEQGVPPYVIFTDRTLHEMARRNPAGGGKAGGQARFFSTRLGAEASGGPARLLAEQRGACGGPATVEDLLEITGVGQAKLERYGQQFFDVIREFWEKHPDALDNDPDAQPLASISAQPDLEPTTSSPGHTPTYVEEARQKHARAYAKWSDEEDESLRKAWDGLADPAASSLPTAPARSCRNAAGRSQCGGQAASRRAGAPGPDAAKIRAIADDFDRKPGAIRSRLKKLGLLTPADDIDLGKA